MEEERVEELAAETALEPSELEVEPAEKDEIAALRAELEQCQQRARANLEGWQRAQADFSNYKRRQRQEMDNLRKFGNEDLLKKLLSLADDFERAFATIPYSLRELSWIEGVWLIGRKLLAIFEQEGIEPIQTKDAHFDPRWHEAVIHEENADYADGQIMEELQRGYRLADRVLRPALVKVAKAPAAPPPSEPAVVADVELPVEQAAAVVAAVDDEPDVDAAKSADVPTPEEEPKLN